MAMRQAATAQTGLPCDRLRPATSRLIESIALTLCPRCERFPPRSTPPGRPRRAPVKSDYMLPANARNRRFAVSLSPDRSVCCRCSLRLFAVIRATLLATRNRAVGPSAASVALLLAGWSPSLAMARMRWSSPIRVGASIASISCPSMNLCIAAGSGGLLVSTNPTGGAGAWRLVAGPGPPSPPPGPTPNQLSPSPSAFASIAEVEEAFNVCSQPYVHCRRKPAPTPGEREAAEEKAEVEEFGMDVACPTTSFCVATSGRARILTSTDPVGAASAWKATRIALPAGRSVGAISCASQSLCVAVEDNRRYRALSGGRVLSSTNPAGGVSAWHAAVLPYVPESVSCVRPDLCLIGTRSGTVLSSRHPTRGARAWRAVRIFGRPGAPDDVATVACATTRYCLAAPLEKAGFSVLVRSTDPTGTASYSWPQVGYGFYPTRRRPRGALFDGGSCTPSGFCALVGSVNTVSGKTLETRVFTSTGRGRPWANARIGGAAQGIYAISCPSSHLCVAAGSTITRGRQNEQRYGELVIGQG